MKMVPAKWNWVHWMQFCILNFKYTLCHFPWNKIYYVRLHCFYSIVYKCKKKIMAVGEIVVSYSMILAEIPLGLCPRETSIPKTHLMNDILKIYTLLMSACSSISHVNISEKYLTWDSYFWWNRTISDTLYISPLLSQATCVQGLDCSVFIPPFTHLEWGGIWNNHK